MSFTSVLANIKDREGHSISEMSRLTGVHRSLITRYLNGSNPSPENRKKLADGLLEPELENAGFRKLKCEECGTSFYADPRYKRKFCKQQCNLRAQAAKAQNYKERYVLGRTTHDLEKHKLAVARFCNWCAGPEGRCPLPKTCSLAPVSPLVYKSEDTTDGV